MATSDVQLTVLQHINKVERRLETTQSSSIAGKLALLLLDLLNEVVAEVSDYGDWQEMFRTVDVTGVASQSTYKITADDEVKNVLEISHSARGISPLQVVDIPTIRRLGRIGSTGSPSQFAIIGVSGTRPKFQTYPVVGTNQAGQRFTVAFYAKPPLYTSADGSTLVPFPGAVVHLGLYAKALANEAGGEATAQYTTAYTEYLRARKEALNRFTSDTGNTVQFIPGRS